ncbi:hypothetical protein Ddye_028118 [Dipteronia dyeriana]|uniref:Importin alpha n=1 Tax=Dipteronia dyeriana TaxID=168575 RepID=A0AAD9WS26_9ROSI|nr:hypothetical protein Ddye_028118 [Dipteronia dyeriana]
MYRSLDRCVGTCLRRGRQCMTRLGNSASQAVVCAQFPCHGPHSMSPLDFSTVYVAFKAVWALVNIASGTSDHTQNVIQSSVVPEFVNILRSHFRIVELKKKATWALGNVVDDSPEARNSVLSDGALKPLIALIDIGVNSSMSRAAVKTLSNFCCVKPPPPPFEQIVRN